MAREIKTVKDNEGNDIEVYVDSCSVCSKEMQFPKNHADEIERMFPFLIEKIRSGTPCVDCVKEKLQQDKDYNPFTKEEIEEIKQKLGQ